jgi:hypothetical protein
VNWKFSPEAKRNIWHQHPQTDSRPCQHINCLERIKMAPSSNATPDRIITDYKISSDGATILAANH